MSYESELKKLQKLWDRGQDNANNIDYAQDRQFIKIQQIKAINTPPLTTKVLDEIGGPYKDISVFQTSPYLVSGFKWTITQTLPENWIPQVRIDVEYNYQGQLGDFSNIVTYFNKVLMVNPVPNSKSDVVAEWQVGLFLVAYDPTIKIPDFKAKLLFTLVDPSDAV